MIDNAKLGEAVLRAVVEFNESIGQLTPEDMTSAYLSLIATAGDQIKQNMGAQVAIRGMVTVMKMLSEGTSVNLMAIETREPERKAKH